MEAEVSSFVRFCSGVDCGRDISYRHGTARYCGETCRRKAEYSRLKPKILAYHAEHKDKIRAYNKQWNKDNPDKVKAVRDKRWKKSAATSKAWRQRNPERTKELKRQSAKRCGVTDGQRRWIRENRKKVRAYKRKWAKNNRPKLGEKTRRRQAAKLNATPVWLTQDQINEMVRTYETARALGLHVDHIVPLQGKSVCGLHVPWNLQMIPADVNIAKGNRHAP